TFWVATGSAVMNQGQGVAQQCDAATGRIVGQPLLWPTPCVAAAFSADARLLAAGSRRFGVQLWDTTTGQPIGKAEPLEKSDDLPALAFTPGDTLVLSGTTAMNKRAGQLWDARSGRPVGERMAPETSPMTAVAFSPDGNAFFMAGGAKSQFWDLATRKPVGN